MLDIYVWSELDKHAVCVDAYGVRLTVAMFLDARVARGFRDWLAGLEGLWIIPAALDADKRSVQLWLSDYQFQLALDTWDMIVNRRQHPAQLIKGDSIQQAYIKE